MALDTLTECEVRVSDDVNMREVQLYWVSLCPLKVRLLLSFLSVAQQAPEQMLTDTSPVLAV